MGNALVRIRSKRRKGMEVSVWSRDGRGIPPHRAVSPIDAYSVTWRAQYWSKKEETFIDKKGFFFEEAVELSRLMLVAVRWICDDAGVPYPTAEDFGLEELDISSSEAVTGTAYPQREEERGTSNGYKQSALPKVEDLFDQQSGFDPLNETQVQAYDEDEIV